MKGYVLALTLSASLLVPAGIALGLKPASQDLSMPKVASFKLVEPTSNQVRDPYHNETKVELTFNRKALRGHRVTLNGNIKYHGKPSSGSIHVNIYVANDDGRAASEFFTNSISFHKFRNLTADQIWICSVEGGAAVNGLRIPPSEFRNAQFLNAGHQGTTINIGEEVTLYTFRVTDGKGHSIAEVTLSVEIQPGRMPSPVSR